MAKLIDITGKCISGEWGLDDNDGTGIPVLRTTNFTNEGIINYNNIVTRQINKAKLDNKYLKHGDIIIEKSGGSDNQPVGRVVYFEGEENKYLFNNFTGLLRVSDKSTWFPKYVFYTLFSNYQKGGTRAFENKTTGLHNLKTDSYVSYVEIKEVSFEEQEEIAQNLDKVIKLISLRKQQLSKLDELVKSRFIEMFGDPISNPKNLLVKTLKQLSTLITNGNTPKGGSENYVENGILFLRSQNIWRNRIELDDVAYIDEATHRSLKKSSLRYKDILITKTGRINTENSSLGRAALYLGKDNSANINGHVYLVRLDGSVVPEYVVTILTSEAYRKYIRKVCVGGIDKRQINLDQVEDFPIILPPFELQEQFATFVEQVDKSKFEIQKSLEKLETLKKALMQKYFG